MKITFVVPGLSLSGGLRVVSIYAQLLAERGHQITVVSPTARKSTLKQYLKSAIRWKGYIFKSGFDKTYFENQNYELKIIDSHRPIVEQDLPDADFVIATWWETAEWIRNFSSSKGQKIYFIQGYEIFNEFLIDRVKTTYRLPFHKICVAKWLVDIMINEFKSSSIDLIPNSVDLKLFNAEKRNKQVTPTIGFLFSEVEIKGVNVTLEVIKKLKVSIPNLKVLSFGSKKPINIELPDHIELYINPAQDKIQYIYTNCDVWLCSSLSEGFGLTILEAMACRVPAVSTKCGGPEDIIDDNVNGILCDVNDISALTDASYTILNLPNREWQKISDNAYLHATSYTWNDAATLFENALLKSLEKSIV